LCNSCASLAGLVLSFIACFILLVIAPLLHVGDVDQGLMPLGRGDVGADEEHSAIAADGYRPYVLPIGQSRATNH